MKNALKGALLSGLVYPGLGHIMLKQYKRGVALILIVSGALIFIIVKAVQRAFVILSQMKSAGGALDINAVTKAANQGTTPFDSSLFTLAWVLLVLCWLFGVIDAYRIGRRIYDK